MGVVGHGERGMLVVKSICVGWEGVICLEDNDDEATAVPDDEATSEPTAAATAEPAATAAAEEPTAAATAEPEAAAASWLQDYDSSDTN